MIIFFGYTHIAINLAIYLLLIRNFDNIGLHLIVLFFVLLGSIFPDIDSPHSLLGRWFFVINATGNYHRKFTHSLLGMLVFGLPITILNVRYGLVFIGSYLSHLICDSMTKKGIMFLYPFNKKWYGIKKFNTGVSDFVILFFLVPIIIESIFSK